MTPYNTGKVLIGCRYEPAKHTPTCTDDFWQSVLLDDEPPHRSVLHIVRDLVLIAVLGPIVGFAGALILVWLQYGS